MADIDCHSEMTNFHRDNVTLGLKQQQQMRVNRNAGRTRLENGLTEAGKPQPKAVHSQGSYQMRTMVQDDDNDYDIDDGAYFASDDLKDDAGAALTPKAARQRVCDALVWDGRLKQEATVKRNCVRQVYAAGYHIDIPVYRIVTTTDHGNAPWRQPGGCWRGRRCIPAWSGPAAAQGIHPRCRASHPGHPAELVGLRSQ